MSGHIRWGIIGTGLIAGRFVTDLALLDDARTVAVGSRTRARAEAFADRYGIAHWHASYQDLVADPQVDAVYVATPHPGHHAAAALAIEVGKAVLVEKPFTLNAGEAADLAARARARGVLCMEAMWTRFLPHMAHVRALLADGALGDVRTVTADHGQWFARDAAHRLFAPELGGGALLDLGVYPVSFASMVLGPPSRVTAVSDPAMTGVDAQTSILLQHPQGRHAVLTTTLDAVSPTTASVTGTDAYLTIDRTWYAPTTVRVHRRGGGSDTVDGRVDGHGMRYEAAEVARCLRAGLTESPLLPLDETVSIMQTLDEVRRQIGLRYPGEDAPAGDGPTAGPATG